MSDIFLWFCEKGSRYKASQLSKTLPVPEGGQSEAKASAPLGPQPSPKNVPPPLLKTPGKKMPEPMAQGPKGPLSERVLLKEYPLNKEPSLPRRGFNLVWKKACCREQGETGRVVHPEDIGIGKGSRSLGGTLKGFGARAPQPSGVHEKPWGRTLSTLKGGEPGCVLRAPHTKAKGDQPCVPSKVPQGAPKVGVVGPKRTRKPLRQSIFKGPALAVAHGNMEIRQKSNHTFVVSELPNLDDLKPGDLIEIFRFGYQHWAIYVGNGYVIHLAPPTEFAGAGCASLMSTLTDKALVKKERLRDVVGKNRYRVNNKHDAKYPPLPMTKIVQRAEERVGQELEYKVTSENCEHFVNELRYGVAKSDQVRDALVGVGIAGLGLAALGLFGAAVVKKRKNQQNQ